MDIQTWASAATVIATGIAVLGLLSRKIDKIETALTTTGDELGARIDNTAAALGARIDNTAATLGARIEQVRAEAQDGHAQTRAEFKADLAEVRADFRFLSERMINFLAHPPEPRSRAHDE